MPIAKLFDRGHGKVDRDFNHKLDLHLAEA
jgi:hypothetical protein